MCVDKVSVMCQRHLQFETADDRLLCLQRDWHWLLELFSLLQCGSETLLALWKPECSPSQQQQSTELLGRRGFTPHWPFCLMLPVLLLTVCVKIQRVARSQMVFCRPRLGFTASLLHWAELLFLFCHLKTSLAILLWPLVSMSHAKSGCLLVQIFWNDHSLNPALIF